MISKVSSSLSIGKTLDSIQYPNRHRLCKHQLILKTSLSRGKQYLREPIAKVTSTEKKEGKKMSAQDRYFPNEMPQLLQVQVSKSPHDTLSELLSLPHESISQRLKIHALDLQEQVVREAWRLKGRTVTDFTLYTGALGTAFLLFKAYQTIGNKDDLVLCLDIINACQPLAHSSGNVTFICGKAGVYALGAVVAKHSGDEDLCQYYLTQFREITLPVDLPDELLYGRAGYLWACSFLNNNLGKGTVSIKLMRAVVNEIIRSGRHLANLKYARRCPLLYEWHGHMYFGAAHGLAGIINVLLDMELTPDEVEDVKGTLRYIIRNRFTNGNYPTVEGEDSNKLVHWCHGAPGVALTLVKAAQVFGDEEFKEAAVEAGEIVWKQGLLKRVGLCHGVSGNAYVFLSLYRLTGKDEMLYRAKAFACFLYDRARTLMKDGIMHPGDHPYSLFEGIGGMAYLFLDLSAPSQARFPAYEL